MSGNGNRPAITVEGLTKQYVTYQRGDSLRETIISLFRRKKVVVDAVRDVSFSIAEGEIVGLLGENGAGKSTTIKMLSGILFPTSGRIDVMGFEPFTQRSRYVERIGAVFGQKSQLIWDIPPVDSFQLNRAIYDIPPADYKRRLDQMVTLLGLVDIIQKPTRVLSLGERMKCEFVMAMLHGPAVVFLDEPTIGVDLIAKESIRDFVRDMNRQGVTFILTTHDLEDVERLAQRVIIITHGEKVFEGALDALKKHLGDQKIVHIVMKSPFPTGLSTPPGITVSSMKSEREAELLVDLDRTGLNELMAYLGQLGDLQDVSIKELGIEAVVRAIYTGEGKGEAANRVG